MAIESVNIEGIRIDGGRVVCQASVVANGRTVQAGFNFKIKPGGLFEELTRKLGEAVADEIKTTFDAPDKKPMEAVAAAVSESGHH